MLRKSNSKSSRDTILLWWFPIKKKFLIDIFNLKTKLPAVFNLNIIFEWSNMAAVSIAMQQFEILP